MKKIFVTTGFIFCMAAAAFAQDKNIKLSVGAELALPSGNLSSTQSFGFGGTAQLEIPLQEKLMGVAYGGIILFKGKSAGGGLNYPGLTIIPIRVGVKYFLTGSVYGGLQAGLGFLSNFGTGTAFSYSPQVGYEFKTNSGKSIDATFKYDGYSKNGSFGSFGLRLAYIF